MLYPYSVAAYASEHPSEHPSQIPPKAESEPSVTIDDVAAYVESYVKDESTDGVFRITDRAVNKVLF